MQTPGAKLAPGVIAGFLGVLTALQVLYVINPLYNYDCSNCYPPHARIAGRVLYTEDGTFILLRGIMFAHVELPADRIPRGLNGPPLGAPLLRVPNWGAEVWVTGYWGNNAGNEQVFHAGDIYPVPVPMSLLSHLVAGLVGLLIGNLIFRIGCAVSRLLPPGPFSSAGGRKDP